jgi:hypothetical protein
MDFLKKMKSRELIEMGLKTILAVLAGLIIIILMEGMIFNIYMDKINKNKSTQCVASDCIAYCEQIGDDEFKVYLNDTRQGSWHVEMLNSTKEEILDSYYLKIVWDSPDAFDVSINYVHYIVMASFIVAILGFYGWRFYKLDREYKGFEKKYKKTGKIF